MILVVGIALPWALVGGLLFLAVRAIRAIRHRRESLEQ